MHENKHNSEHSTLNCEVYTLFKIICTNHYIFQYKFSNEVQQIYYNLMFVLAKIINVKLIRLLNIPLKYNKCFKGINYIYTERYNQLSFQNFILNLARDCIVHLFVNNMLLNVCFWHAVNWNEKSNTKEEKAVSKK